MGLITKEILYNRRDFFIDKVKAPIYNKLMMLAHIYPRPTHDNTVHKNSRILIDMFEEIKKNLQRNNSRQEFIDSLERVIVGQHESDGFYAFLLEFAIKYLNEHGFEHENRGYPMWRHWDGDLWDDNCMETNPKYLKEWEEYMERNHRDKITHKVITEDEDNGN